jgi:hypothetical protein
MPVYVAVPISLLASAVAALALAILGAVVVSYLLDGLNGRDDLDNAFLAFFYAGPAIALLGFVSCFSILVRWHRATSWRTPTFAFALGAVLVWVWARGFGGIGVAWYVPGAVGWLLSFWFLSRKGAAHTEHVAKA